MRDSIFYSSVRSFFIAFFVVIGICVGFMVIFAIIGAVSSGAYESKLSTNHTEEILPNAEGQREVLASNAPVILQLNITSVIGLEGLDTKSVRQKLVESREGSFKNNRVKAILLYINTPGGTVNDADGIFRALVDYKKKYQVPIYAYVDGLCASGGMYVALAADKIFASDTSLIGSVGVIAPTFFNVTKLLDKIGVDTLTISAGKGKDALSPFRQWNTSDDENYRHIIEHYYNHFVELVTTHRPEMKKEELIKDYGAHIFPAPQAKEYGFIDVSGLALGETIKELLQAADITQNYQLIRLESKTWWSALFSNSTSSLFPGEVKHQLSISPEADLLLRNQFLYLYYPQ